MVLYFLKACNEAGLSAEALKCIPAKCNDEGDGGIETIGTRFPLMKKAGRLPCPLSAKLYQAQKVNTVSPEELVQLVRKAVMEVRQPHPMTISEVVWPDHTERKSNNREMSLSAQALRHLMPSPSPVDMVENTELTAHTDDPEEEQPVQTQLESLQHLFSSEDLSSVSSFTSASSLPLLRRDRPYVYESTLTLQRISSLLTDGENQSREEEDEEEDNLSIEALPDCPELTVTLDGATDPIFLSTLNEDALAELLFSAEEGKEDAKTDVFSSEDFLGAGSGPSMNESLLVNKRMNPPLQKDDSQTVPNFCEPQVQSYSFLSPGDEKEEILHSSPDVTDLWSSALSLNQEDQSDCIASEIISFSEAATSDCFLEEETHQKTYEYHQQEDTVGCFSPGFSGAMSETSQDLLTDPHQCLLLEDPEASSSVASAGMDQWDVSLLTPVCSSICPTELQQISGTSLTPSPACKIKTTSALSDTTNESSPKAQLKTDDSCVQSTSVRPHNCEIGSSWKQDLETSRDSSGPLPATELGAAITPDNKRPSLVLSQQCSSSLVNFMDFTAKRQEDKQADKEEPAGWSTLGRGSQGAIRSGRTRLRKGKRVKRA